MLVITLICNLGMSTSVLVDKMAAYTKEKGIEADIEARAFQRVEDRIHRTDILLIGPQVRYLAKKFQTEHGGEIPVIQTLYMSITPCRRPTRYSTRPTLRTRRKKIEEVGQ